MTDEELITQLRIQDHSEMCLAAAGRIEAFTGQLAEVQEELSRRVDMHECAMAERDDATLYGVEQKARADRAEAALTAQPSPDVAELVKALEFYADRDNYEPVYERMPCDCCTEIYEPVKRDEGDIARAALARMKGGAA